MEDKIEHILSPLENIEKVEVSPFLFTRIAARVQNEFDMKISKTKAWAYGLSFCLLIVFNLFALKSTTVTKAPQGDLVEKLKMLPDNYLYE